MTATRTPDLPDGLPDDAGLAARFHAAAPVLSADPGALIARGRRRRRAVRASAAVLSVAAVAAVATAAVGLLGGAPTPPADTTPPSPEGAGAVSLWLSAERVPPGDSELVAVLVSNDGTEATFGVPAALERWDGSAWRLHRRTNMCLDHWHCTARWYPPDAAEVQGAEDIGLGVAAGAPGPVERFTVEGLEPGWYRVVQEAYGGVVAHGVFEVAGDAPGATPLWPTDEAAVSVRPPLVAPDGGAVTLSPLVPPVDGTLDEGMLEGAMAGLDDEALVQRWGADGWAEVDRVALSAQDDVSVPGELRAELPALEPGAYRLLLRGNGKELMGSFWVPGTAGPATAAPTQSPTGSPTEPTDAAEDDGTRPPCYDMHDLLCAMDLWLVDSIEAAGYATAGGDHDIGQVATDSALVGAGAVGARVSRLADLGPGDLHEATTVVVGELTVHHGSSPGVAASSAFDCGAFRMGFAGDVEADVRAVTEAVAAAVDGACPADDAALLARYAAELG